MLSRWMYEVLGLAMQAAHRPAEEIERAVMSAVDFASSTLDLMYLGRYLENVGLPKRALQVYRQVAQLEPLRPEPFVHGLRVAQKVNDLDGIQWATVGILGQAWPSQQMPLWEQAARVAKATLEKLEAEKRLDEAKRLSRGPRCRGRPGLLDQGLLDRGCRRRRRGPGAGRHLLLLAEPQDHQRRRPAGRPGQASRQGEHRRSPARSTSAPKASAAPTRP